ncbi:MAG: hypothetical protein M1411_04610 [Candidatus Thermoplasmatota archaeon]|jgi:hypothetical protein|nr:hypothetical protein [Candidatus Thermoplasmatota archaeon]
MNLLLSRVEKNINVNNGGITIQSNTTIDNKLKLNNTGLNRLNNLFKCMLIIKLNIKHISSIN